VFIEDGQTYDYMPETVPENVRAVAVGWLDAHHPYNLGPAEADFVERLFEACRSHVSVQTRGWHRCGLCPALGEEHSPPTTATHGQETIIVGDTELRVIGRDGAWLIAPTLVIHYVTEHDYAPQPEFVEAVMAGRFANADDDAAE
jgi:hypothetical protein